MPPKCGAVITLDANAVNVRGIKPVLMLFSSEQKTIERWVNRIQKKVPCSVDSMTVAPESVEVKLRAKNDDEVGYLLRAIEDLTGAEIQDLPFGGEASFYFHDNNVDITIKA